jgi:hypothetical protein
MVIGGFAVTAASPEPAVAASPTPGPIRFDEFPTGTPTEARACRRLARQ